MGVTDRDDGRRNAFICAAGHSGSTLLDMLLGSHSRAESIGEVINLPMDLALDSPCACGRPIQQCDLWPEVVRGLGVDPRLDPYALNLGYTMPTVGDPALTSPRHRWLTRPRIALAWLQLRHGWPTLGLLTPTFSAGIATTLALYDRVRERTGKQVIVDSSKHYVRAAALYAAQPERTRIVMLVRDGRGVFYSGLRHGFGRRRSVSAWRNHHARTFDLLERRVPPEHRLAIRYEDLVTDPAGALGRLCGFLDLEYEPAMLDFRAVTHHNVNGNAMKMTSTSALRLDEAWRTRLGSEDLAYFERLAGDLNRRLGYV